VTPYEALAQMRKGRHTRDPYEPQTTGDKMQAQTEEDPTVKFKKRIGALSGQVAQTTNPYGS
jgi:hypothetical protein